MRTKDIRQIPTPSMFQFKSENTSWAHFISASVFSLLANPLLKDREKKGIKSPFRFLLGPRRIFWKWNSCPKWRWRALKIARKNCHKNSLGAKWAKKSILERGGGSVLYSWVTQGLSFSAMKVVFYGTYWARSPPRSGIIWKEHLHAVQGRCIGH